VVGQFVAQVDQRIGFAVAVGGQGRADGCQQVGAVEADGGQVGALAEDSPMRRGVSASAPAR
jgi:hypothetical protein